MRPLRVSIAGLRSFRARVDLDFDDRMQIAVIGDTGAGKSSILEAMTYALYGRTAAGSAKQELINDNSDVMRVVLRFRVAGEEWEVTRVDRRTGAGGLGPARAQLVRYGPDGETLEKVEQVKPVNSRIQALIGLDNDAFLRTVILPQGRFARLLVEDAPSARTEILRQVWRTQDLEAAGEVAGQRLGEVRMLAVQLRGEVERHPDDPEEHLADLISKAEAASLKAGALAGLRDDLRRPGIPSAPPRRRCSGRESERERDPGSDGRTDGPACSGGDEHRRIEAETTELEGQKASLKRELNGIPVDDGPDHHEIARTLAALDAIPNEVQRAVEAAQELREAIASEVEAEKHHAQTRQALESAQERVTRH